MVNDDQNNDEIDARSLMPILVEGIAIDIPSVYDDSLYFAGQAAHHALNDTIFASYQKRRAKNTRERQVDNLQIFARYLLDAGSARNPLDLYNDPLSWQGINGALVEGFKEWALQQGYAIRSINVCLSTIRTYCAMAYKAGVISSDAHLHIKGTNGYSAREGVHLDEVRVNEGTPIRVGKKKALPTAVSARQARQLRVTPKLRTRAPIREHDKSLHERDILMNCLFGEHGLRVSEVIALEAHHIDLDAGCITIYRPKTNTRDVYELMPATRDAAEDYLPLIPEDGPLFPGYNGKHITRQAIFNRVREIGKQLGIDNLSPHDLRHLWAMLALRSGNSLDVVQAYGGWSSPAMVLHYAKLFGAPKKGLKLDL